jgi:prepilin-type N-terminal cleavage/methylation domain-containing protein
MIATAGLHRKTRRERGFSLIEVMVAVFVLVTGMFSVAALMTQMFSKTNTSREESLVAMLASEKLEDLNRFATTSGATPCADPNIWAPDGGTAGSLTQDMPSQSITSGGCFPAETVDYSDTVQITAGGNAGGTTGAIAETVKTAAGYVTTYHSPNGQIGPTLPSGAPPTPTPDSLVFKRRWFIEKDPVINGAQVTGVRRITVVVQLTDVAARPVIPFQMTMVRP